MKYIPTQNKRPAIILSAICLLIALILVGLSALWGDFLTKALIILSILPLLASLYIISRYASYNYIYEITDQEFIVSRINTSAQKTVCRLNFHHILSIQKQTKSSNKNMGKAYNYCASILCKDAYIICYEIDGEYGNVIIEASEYFAKNLEKYIKNDIILN